MNKFIPKSLLDWIWLGGMVSLVSLVIYTLAVGESPFETLGMNPKTTTVVVGLLMIAAITVPHVLRKKE